MADHFRKFMRTWRRKTASTTYATLVTDTLAHFFGAGDQIAFAEKWACYGELRCVTAPGTAGATGMRLPFTINKDPSSNAGTLWTGTVELVGAGVQFCQMSIVSNSLVIEAKAQGASGTSIICVTMDAYFIGGPGPTA